MLSMVPNVNRDLDPKLCMSSTEFFDSSHETIHRCLQGLNIGSQPLTERAQIIFGFVRDQIEYEFKAKLRRAEYRASHVLSEGRGFCIQKATLLAALGRGAGIPTALVLSDLRDRTLPRNIVDAMGTDVLYRHGFNAFFLNDHWLLVDASLTRALATRKGLRLVNFDGLNDALLANTTVRGTPHAEYIRWHGLFADLPYQEIMETFRQLYSNANLEVLT